ncbi:hypothetical protein DVH05_014682 [Phytophthora capsici]|nr:hypothetical protein DVH05_014682 [Phytophthora capsici]
MWGCVVHRWRRWPPCRDEPNYPLVAHPLEIPSLIQTRALSSKANSAYMLNVANPPPRTMKMLKDFKLLYRTPGVKQSSRSTEM